MNVADSLTEQLIADVEETAEIVGGRIVMMSPTGDIVWDVDLLGDDIVREYRADSPHKPLVYRRGEVAEAEPSVPGWAFPVDELFD